ncbi:MAG TPA: hypothetical protein VF018_08195 [Acidobacteriaceae bacterium]
MFTAPAAAGAVKSPAELTVPALADQVTAELKFPVPFTIAAHCEVAPLFIVAGLHAAETDAIVEEDACTFTAVLPDITGSCVLVAIKVTLPTEAGAVNTPLVFTVPALADQLTAEL